LRGKFIREVLLCTDVPPPPGDIDFSEFAEEGGDRRTGRERLAVHVTNDVCAGCHSLMDPIGLALENMDGIGAYRETENDVVIDPSGNLNGADFADAVGLGDALAQDPGLGPCLVRSLYKYAMGREVELTEEPFVRELETRFEDSGYRFRDLLQAIVMSDAFRRTSGAREAEEPEDTPTPAPTWTATPVPTGPTSTPGGETPTPRPTATPLTVTLQQLQDRAARRSSVTARRCARAVWCSKRELRLRTSSASSRPIRRRERRGCRASIRSCRTTVFSFCKSSDRPVSRTARACRWSAGF
jgi:hypothetical protein